MISIDKNSKISLYKQLYMQLKEQILTGKLIAGQKLPATRELASDLMLGRNTVIAAYDQLQLEGFVKSVTGSGYYVEQIDLQNSIFLDMPSRIVSFSPSISTTHYKYDFQYGDLDYNCYQTKTWRKCVLEAFDQIALQSKISYTEHKGNLQLRKGLADYLHLSRGVKCTSDQIVITSGHQHSLEIIAHIFSNKDWHFAMENPGYNGTRIVFERNNHKIIPIPLESDGIMMSVLEDIHNALLYITPSHQFPMGSVLPITKRLSLLDWADQNNSYIIEDDYDSELRYNTLPIPSLQSIDHYNRTIYLGTFSKSLSPDLRIAFLVLPEPLMTLYNAKYQLANCSVPSFLQIALANFIGSGDYQKHINSLRAHYRKKNNLILTYLQKTFPPCVKIQGTSAGLHFILTLDTSLNQQELISRFAESQIHVYATDIYWINQPVCPKNQILIGFSSIPTTDIPESIEKLSEVLRNI